MNPTRLRIIATACDDWRTLLHRRGGNPADVVAHKVIRCARLVASDGFVYNCCILALDRMIHRKQTFARMLATQWFLHTRASQQQHQRCTTTDLADFVQLRLAGHIEVLMKAAASATDVGFLG